jgi:hypothetical protein
MSTIEKPTAPFVLSLIAGVLIIAGGGTGMMWSSSGMPMYGGMMGGMMGGMIGNWQGMMGGMGFGGFLSVVTILGVISGVIILIGSVMLYSQPSQTQTWGIIVLVFSLISLFGMGGFFIGAILGFVGGILALTWNPTTAVKTA